MRITSTILGVLALTLLLACSPSGDVGPPAKATDPLPSWNDLEAKQAILDFVTRVTDPTSPDFVPEAERIATFDNDGTLWAEQPMLEWTTAGVDPSFGLYVHHDDAEREWAYDRESSIGRLDRGLDEAAERGWVVASMRKDWRRVFPFEPEGI